MKNLKNKFLIFAAIGVLGYYVLSGKMTKQIIPEINDPELSKKFNFHLIPDKKNNYRSAQITPKELEKIIKKYNIKNIIRLNGDGADGRHTSSLPITTKAQEQKLAQNLGVNFFVISSHEGYVKNKGYTKSLQKVSDILNKGNTLIHCAHGSDRTGGLIGGYLKNGKYITDLDKLWEYTTKYNGWQRMIRNNKFFGSGYDKYADTFYPIDQLKVSKWVK